MSEYDCDLFVIGAGSGGVRAARLAAMTGARVLVAEEYRVGGTCVIRGCVPKKLMVYASAFRRDFELAKGYGWTKCETAFDWRAFLTAKDAEIARLSGIYTANLNNAGADILYGTARFVDPHTLEVTGENKPRRYTAEKVLIAAGDRGPACRSHARHRACRHLGTRPSTCRTLPKRHGDRRRRLYRGGVRRHLPRHGRAT